MREQSEDTGAKCNKTITQGHAFQSGEMVAKIVISCIRGIE